MQTEPLDAVPLWLLFGLVCAMTWAALEGGYRIGRWRHGRTTEEKETPVGAMVASILALFAFLLAFTFGMAATRFEERRQAVLHEANAIGTAYLRTRLLPEPERAESAQLLREYVDIRVRGIQEKKVQEVITKSGELHERLWAIATRSAERSPTPITGLYIQSLNELIDLHAVRVQVGIRNRIPSIIWIALFSLAILGMASVGYQSGLSATRRSPAMAVLIAAFAGVLFLIADLDRTSEGLLHVSQQAMVDLQTSMHASAK